MLETIMISLPWILALLAIAFAWRQITHRTLFFLTAALAMLGFQSLVAPAVVFSMLPSTPDLAATNEALTRSLVVASLIQIVAGVPFLWWLKSAFRRSIGAPDTSRPDQASR